MTDPFRHHPDLRDKIKPADASFFRHMTTDDFRSHLAKHDLADAFPFHSEPHREALRRDALDGHSGDLWVFAYGSLMWDPGIVFSELRRAHSASHARRFILRDIWGARGTEERPGLMAALDQGDGCHGLAFRIEAHSVEDETRRLWAREAPGPGYVPTLIPVEHDDGRVHALAFLADHKAEGIVPDLPRETQIEYLATGTDFLGSSYDYIRTLAEHFTALGIDDPHVSDLLAEVEIRRRQT